MSNGQESCHPTSKSKVPMDFFWSFSDRSGRTFTTLASLRSGCKADLRWVKTSLVHHFYTWSDKKKSSITSVSGVGKVHGKKINADQRILTLQGVVLYQTSFPQCSFLCLIKLHNSEKGEPKQCKLGRRLHDLLPICQLIWSIIRTTQPWPKHYSSRRSENRIWHAVWFPVAKCIIKWP